MREGGRERSDGGLRMGKGITGRGILPITVGGIYGNMNV